MCNCGNSFNGACRCGNCEEGFKGRTQAKKEAKKELRGQGMRRKDARQIVRASIKLEKGMKKMTGGIVNPAMEGMERPMPNLNPAMNPTTKTEDVIANPALSAGVLAEKERGTSVPNAAMAGKNERPNPAEAAATEPTPNFRPNPAMRTSAPAEEENQPEVEISEEAPETGEETPADNNADNKPPKKNKYAWAWIVGGALALLILIFLLLMFLKKS